jgi:DNA-binding MarR family transcriptional regulator
VSEIELQTSEYRAAAELRAGLRHFLQTSAQVLQAHGLTSERYELLLAIKGAADGSERATVGQVTAALGLAHSSATQLARRAEDAGLLHREVSAHDARVRYLRLTDAGERQLAGAVAELRRERERLADVAARLPSTPQRSRSRRTPGPKKPATQSSARRTNASPQRPSGTR